MNYVVFKSIDYTNPQKQLDELGRKVYMNCAFSGGDGDALELKYLAEGFLKYYNAAARMMCDMLELCRNTAGYTVNFDLLERLIEECVNAGKMNVSSYKVNFDKQVSAVALDADWAYFCEQNKVNKLLKPNVLISYNEYKNLIMNSKNSFGDAVRSAKTADSGAKGNVLKPENVQDANINSNVGKAFTEITAKKKPTVEDAQKSNDKLNETLKASEMMANELKKKVYAAENEIRRLAKELSKSKSFLRAAAAIIAVLVIVLIVLIFKIKKGG